MKLRIEKLDYEGRGLGRCEGKVCFVSRALPGEEVEISFQKEEKNYFVGRLDKLNLSSKMRVASYCPYADRCGGCTYDILTYEDSLQCKKGIVEELLERKEIPVSNLEIVPSPKPLGYRNKISLKVQDGGFGFYEEESHEFVEIKNCFLAKPSIQEFLKDFKSLHLKNGSLVVRSNYNDELLIIIESEESPLIDEDLALKHKIAGIIWNKKCVYQNSFFFEKRGNLLYKVHWDAFFQINQEVAEKIAQDVAFFFRDTDQVFDLYCGVGYFSLKLSHIVKSVTGIEVNLNAILDAKYNADLNHLDNVSFHSGAVENLLKKIPLKANKVLVDPPRSGLNKQVINVLLEKNFETICYISCNPKTLIRDIDLLKSKYQVQLFRIYDMFPFTKHAESLCVLKGRK